MHIMHFLYSRSSYTDASLHGVSAGYAFLKVFVFFFLDSTFKKFSRASSMDEDGGSATNADAAFLCHQDSIAIYTHLRTK